MPRVALGRDQRIAYKILDFKLWVREQMARNDMTQEDIGKVLGVSQGHVSQMLKIKKKQADRIKPDPFTLGQVLILFEMFGADEDVRKKLLAP